MTGAENCPDVATCFPCEFLSKFASATTSCSWIVKVFSMLPPREFVHGYDVVSPAWSSISGVAAMVVAADETALFTTFVPRMIFSH